MSIKKKKKEMNVFQQPKRPALDPQWNPSTCECTHWDLYLLWTPNA